MVTDKQWLQVIETKVVWNGMKWILLYEIMLQPKGEFMYMVERVHMGGDIIGREFIGKKEVESLYDLTRLYLNK